MNLFLGVKFETKIPLTGFCLLHVDDLSPPYGTSVPEVPLMSVSKFTRDVGSLFLPIRE